MKIGLLGGAFNPPHIGHILIAQQVLDFTDIDEVWFLPNFSQIPPKPVADVHHRLKMTMLIKLAKTRVSTLEIDHTLDGDTIHLLPLLPSEHAFRFIIGSDQLPTLHLWGEWESLIAKMPFLVFPRYGFPNEPLYENMTLITDENLVGTNISSSKIRERVRRGLPISNFVPESVASYIHDHNLYR